MAKFRPEDYQRDTVQGFVGQDPTLAHLQVRRRADYQTNESGREDHPILHARFRRVVQYWRLEMATHMGRWEQTPFRGPLDEVLTLLVRDFGWVRGPPENSDRT